MQCIVCNSEKYSLSFKDIKDLEYYTYEPVNYVTCSSCGLISQDPLPKESLIPTFYPESYRNYLPSTNGAFSFLKNMQFERLARNLNKYFSRGEKFLEIGFGSGGLLLALNKMGYENLSGIDFNDRNFSMLKEKGIKLAVANIENHFPFTEKFDVIFMNNVIEHFLNPIKVLENCKEHLSENGKIILITPNSNALEFSIFKKHWAGFHAPRHTFIFNEKNIKSLSEKLGFKHVKILPVSDPGQWSISIQNIFQDLSLTKIKLKNGMAWYTLPLSIVCTPVAALQNCIRRSTSILCVLRNR